MAPDVSLERGGKEYQIGEGKPEFTVSIKKNIPLPALMTSTSLALGEAYMDGDLEIEGDLYYALDHFLGQMDKFSTDQSALRKLIFPSSGKKNQKKEVQSHYDIGNDFYRLRLEPDGLFLLRFISPLKEHPGDAWIKKYIFHNGIIDLHQILFTKGIDNEFPMARWY